MKIRDIIKSEVLKNVTDRNELTDEKIFYMFKEFTLGRYTPNDKKPAVCFEIKGDIAIAYMNHENVEKFRLLNSTTSPEFIQLLQTGKLTQMDIHELMSRHTANMSDLCDEDIQYNEDDIKCSCGRVYSRFDFKGYKISINTYLYEDDILNAMTGEYEDYTTHIRLV